MNTLEMNKPYARMTGERMYNWNALRNIRYKEDENDEDLRNDGTSICSWKKSGCLHHKVMEREFFL